MMPVGESEVVRDLGVGLFTEGLRKESVDDATPYRENPNVQRLAEEVRSRD
jgi:hypothetical protein